MRDEEAALTKMGVMTMQSLNILLDNLDISTRSKRRQAISLIVDAASRIHRAEYEYLERIPQNLHGGNAYAAADESVDMLAEAITILSDAY